MLTSIHGFAFKHADFPLRMTPVDLLDFFMAKGGQSFKGTVRVGAEVVPVKGPTGTLENWVAGIALRVRNADALTMLEESGGKLQLVTHALNEGARLAEPSFFLAHPRTGGMFYASHRGAASLSSFAFICTVFLRAIREEKRAAALQGLEDEDEIKVVKQAHAGKFEWEQLYREEAFKILVKKLRTVHSFEAEFRTTGTRRVFWQGLQRFTEKEKVKFIFAPDAPVDDLAEAIDAEMKKSVVKLDGIAVKGSDGKRERTVRPTDNPLIFDLYEYGEAEANLSIDLADWGPSIVGNATIARLIRLAGISQYQMLVAP